MEVIILIGVAWFLWSVYDNYKKAEAKEKIEQLIETMAKERRENVFVSKVESKTIDGDDFDWDVFQVNIKGIIDGPNDNFKAKYVVQLKDVTDGDLPIYSMLEEFQHKDSRLFWYESDEFTLPYETTVLNDWMLATNIPKMFLEFPRSGSRKIKFETYVVDPYTDKILVEDTKTVTYYSSDKGYQDKADDTEYFEEMVIKSAMLVSASDGHIDIAEADVVKSWIKRRISMYRDNFKESEKQRLNGYIKDASREIENNTLDFRDILEGIENIASEGEKYELFEVCLDVAKADGEADPEELKLANDIASYMGLDKNKFRSMIEKTLPVTMHTERGNDENMFGIHPDMTSKEAKKVLRQEYQKWNARVASSDPEVRKQASEMIERIAKMRENYA